MATQLTKGQIGKDDAYYNTSELYPTETFTRTGQLSTTTLTKFPDVYKSHYSIVNACNWNSAAKNDTTITQALSYIGGNSRSLYIEPGDWTISNSLTIPANVELIIAHKATLTVASGKTLTINGPIVAPPVQVFSGSGTVTINSTGALWVNTWKGLTNDVLYLQNEGLAAEVNTFTATDATPSVADGLVFKTANNVPTTITSFDDGYAGQIIHVIIGDANTTFDFSSGNLRGFASTTWAATQNSVMVCQYDGTYWYCIVPSETASVLTTTGDMLYASAANTLARLGKGTAYQVLAMDSSGNLPAYTTDVLSPWRVDIDVFTAPLSQTNWSTVGLSSNYLYLGYKASSGDQNAVITWPVVLSAGTWAISVTHATDSTFGIISVQIDGSTVGTIDTYAAASYNNVTSITGISVTSPGKKVVGLLMATKHASSAGYTGSIQHVALTRTA